MLSTLRDGKRRDVASLKILIAQKLRNVYQIKVKMDDTMRIVWETIAGYIYTNDGYAIQTSDNYFIKCNDQ